MTYTRVIIVYLPERCSRLHDVQDGTGNYPNLVWFMVVGEKDPLAPSRDSNIQSLR